MSKDKPKGADRPPEQSHDRDSSDERLREANEQLTLATLRAQEQADESALRYRDLIEDLDAVAWEATTDPWRYTFLSHQVQRLFGYPAERWLQDPNFWIELIHPDDRRQTVNACKAGIAQATFRVEYRAHTRGGAVIWIALTARVRRPLDGPVQARGLLVDVTELKRQAEEHRELNAQLKASQARLQEKIDELEKFAEVTVGRELRMIELEKEVEHLRSRLKER